MSMIVFSYRGRDSQGTEAQGTVEALDKEDALKKLRLLEAQGLRDLTIEGLQQSGSVPSASTETSRRFCGSCGQENLVQYQFCASCGSPLGEAIQGRPAAHPATTKGSRKQPELPLWQRVFCLLCLGLTGWMLYTAMPKSAPRPSSSPSSSALSAAATTAKNERLEKIILDKYRDVGVLKVEVDGPVMTIDVTPATYRLLLTDRVAGNRIMRGWQTLVAQNDSTTGVGAVMLYSEGHKVAKADKNILSGEIKVEWFDA